LDGRQHKLTDSFGLQFNNVAVAYKTIDSFDPLLQLPKPN